MFVLIAGSCTTAREQEVEGDLNQFRSWVNAQANMLADQTEDDWERAKEDFVRRTRDLDRNQQNFTADVRQEYQQLKDEFNSLDEKHRLAMERKERVAQWERDLLGPYADQNAVSASNVRRAYITFLENVRTKSSNWTNEDWEMAKLVRDNLDTRKAQIDNDLPTEDEVKIKALQMEFTTLETGHDISN